MHGLHLTADLHGCSQAVLALHDCNAVKRICLHAVSQVQLRAVGQLFHTFEPAGSGITGFVLLAESHVAVHTWPEMGAVTLDVYVCNVSEDNSKKASRLLDLLTDAFEPMQVERHQLVRGALPPSR